MIKPVDQAHGYTEYFNDRAGYAYIRGSDGTLQANPESFGHPRWQDPAEAIYELSKKYRDNYAASMIGFNEKTIVPAVAAWLQERGIKKISCVDHGNSAFVFEAQLPGSPNARCIFRLGGTRGRIDNVFSRAWCPLVLQPYDRARIEYEDYGHLTLELLPFVGAVSSGPSGFHHFLNNHVLANTPYAVTLNDDLGVAPDGTPLYVDPDKLNFKTEELAKKHARDQFDPEWQQKIMATIAANCARHGFRAPLQWVAQGRGGRYYATQAMIYPNPLLQRPDRRKLIRLKASAANNG